jgi:hypothetical protein
MLQLISQQELAKIEILTKQEMMYIYILHFSFLNPPLDLWDLQIQ